MLSPLQVIGSSLTCQDQRLMSSPPPRSPVPSQIHRRLLFAKSRSQAVSKSSEASLALGLSPADSNKCIITLSSFEVRSLDHFHINLAHWRPSIYFNSRSRPLQGCSGRPQCGMSALTTRGRTCLGTGMTTLKRKKKWERRIQRRDLVERQKEED